MSSYLKIGIALVLCFVAYKLLNPAPVGAKELSPELLPLTEEAKSAGKKRIVILFTGTEWCPPCQSLDKKVIQTPEWKAFEESEIQFQVFDFPAQGEVPQAQNSAANHFAITSFPTLVVTDLEGKVLRRGGYNYSGFGRYRDWILAP